MQKYSTALLSKFGVTVILTAATLITVTPARAEFPEKIIRIIVPFAPGGGTDNIARALADGMTRDLGQQVIVENKPGGGTIIGTEAVAKSTPDGHTLLMATFAHAVNPSFHSKLPYVTDKAFTPVSLIGISPNVLVVRADSPYKTVKDLITAAKANPRKITYASQGNGTSAHLAGELFSNLAKVELVHIPYRGAGPAITDLLGGHVDMIFGTAAAVSGHIKGGKLRPIAVTTDKRSPALPDIPTLAESGLPGYAAESWYGIYAPAGTPANVIARLNSAVKKASAAPDFQKRATEEGLAVIATPPAELDSYVRAEEARWKKIVQENQIKPN